MNRTSIILLKINRCKHFTFSLDFIWIHKSLLINIQISLCSLMHVVPMEFSMHVSVSNKSSVIMLILVFFIDINSMYKAIEIFLPSFLPISKLLIKQIRENFKISWLLFFFFFLTHFSHISWSILWPLFGKLFFFFLLVYSDYDPIHRFITY